MKIYYYGFIVENDSNDHSKIKIVSTLPIDEIKFNAREGENIGLPSFKRYCYGDITNKRTEKLLDDLKFYVTPSLNIIYEVFEDENGILYAKELLTGLLFPFTTDKNSNTNYYQNDDEIQRIWNRTDDNMAKIKFTVVQNQVANKNMINKYKRTFSLKRKIKNLYNENVFEKEIIEKKEKALETQNKYTKLMEDIELLLQLLKKQNPKSYSKLIEEYKNIKNGKDDTLVAIEPTIEDFKKFISKIKLHLTIQKDFKDLDSYLLNAIENYYLKMETNELNDKNLSINDLDNITEMFLINKDDYDMNMQRQILKNISMLYLFVTKSNINNITINKLNESYFKDNLKTILLSILTLNEMQIIKNAPNVNFDDNVTVESIFDMIKEIEFNKVDKNKVKNLIK